MGIVRAEVKGLAPAPIVSQQLNRSQRAIRNKQRQLPWKSTHIENHLPHHRVLPYSAAGAVVGFYAWAVDAFSIGHGAVA